MALPRVCSFGRTFLPRGSARIANSVALSTRLAIPRRQFTSFPRLWQEAFLENDASSGGIPRSTTVSETQRNKNSRSVILLNFPKEAGRSEAEEIFRREGLDVIDVSTRINRFTFENSRMVVVELKEEQQVNQATAKLGGITILGQECGIRPVKSDFVWTPDPKFGRQVSNDEAGMHAAIQPLLEGRRLHVAVKTPGWGDMKTPLEARRQTDYSVIRHTLKPFGIESFGGIGINWGDLAARPRFLCFVDFETKEGAEQAIQAVHDTEVRGRLVWLTVPALPPWRAHQIGKWSPAQLALLQEKGIAPREIDGEKYSKPLKTLRLNKATEKKPKVS